VPASAYWSARPSMSWLQLFRRGVADGANGDIRRSESPRVTDLSGDPEISQQHTLGAAGRIVQKDVGGLDVSVQQPIVVGIVQCICNGSDDVEYRRGGRPPGRPRSRCAASVPSMKSTAIQSRPSSSPWSLTRTMFGCHSLPARSGFKPTHADPQGVEKADVPRPRVHTVPTICPQSQINRVNYRDVFQHFARTVLR